LEVEVNEAIDTVILHEELAYADVLPLAFTPLTAAPEPAVLASWAERNLRMLQAAAALDEQGPHDKSDDETPGAAQIQRMDLKINLLLELVGDLIATSQARPPAVPLHFNAQGIVWSPDATQPRPRPNSTGRIEIYLRSALVRPLTFTGRIQDAEANGPVQLRFDPLTEVIADQIEKLVFRRHRRRIAGARLGRRGSERA
jgi:hypothetical protein